MNKLELACVIRELGITEMWVDRVDKQGNEIKRRMGQNSFFESGGKWAPTNDELKARLRQYLDENPNYQKTEVQKLFDEHGYQLIYTPPYTPTTQPIEMVWGYVKGYVAGKFKNNRTIDTLRKETLAGMYGDGTPDHKGVTADYCSKVINKCHKWCDSFIKSDGVLVGSIGNMRENPSIDRQAINIDDDEEHEAEPFAGEAMENSDEDD